MIVLHYIPSLMKKEGQAAKFVQTIHAALGKTMESHLITGEPSRSEFVRQLARYNPDIVHIHGCWNISSARVERWTRQRGYPVVLSLHGGMNHLAKRDDFWTRLMPRILLYQYRMVRKAFTLHASSAEELNELKSLGWKKRIALIPYPTDAHSADVMAMEFRQIYQKIIDTRRMNRLTVTEEQCLWALMTADADNADLADSCKQRIAALSAHEWQSISVYAIDHNITGLLDKALKRYGIEPTVRVTQLPARYSVKSIAQIAQYPSRLKGQTATPASSSPEEAIAREMFMLKYNIIDHCICDGYLHPMPLFIRIYGMIRWTDYDENMLKKQLEQLGMTSFASRLMQIYSEMMNLTIGFMPLDPTDDATTEAMRRSLNSMSGGV